MKVENIKPTFKVVKVEGPFDKDYYNLTINGKWLGVFERSDMRFLIEKIDNAINVGIERNETIEVPVSEYKRMLDAAREAALNEGDEDCLMCGS